MSLQKGSFSGHFCRPQHLTQYVVLHKFTHVGLKVQPYSYSLEWQASSLGVKTLQNWRYSVTIMQNVSHVVKKYF